MKPPYAVDSARLAEILEATSDLVCLSDSDGAIVYLNPRARRTLGVPAADDVSGRSVREVRTSAGHEVWLREGLPSVREHGQWTGDTAWKTGDGCEIVVSETVSIHRGADGGELFSTIGRDVTRAREAEQARLAAHRLSQEILDSVKEGIVVYDRDMRYRMWNSFMEQLSGISADIVLGKRAPEMFPYIHEQGLDKLIERALLGETVRGPDLFYTAIITGRSGWGTSNFSPHIDSTGEIAGVVATIQDITERKGVEEVLRSSEERYRLVFQGASDGLFLFPLDEGDVVGPFVDVNDAACRMLGYPREELLRRSPVDVQPAGVRGTRTLLDELRRAGRVVFERTLIRSDGVPVEAEISAHLIGLANPPLVLAIVRDVTERHWAEEALRRSEARFRAISEASPVGIFVTDPGGGGLYMNRAAQDICGLTPEEAKGRGWEASIHPEDIAQVAYEWDAAVSAGRPCKLVHRVLRLSGDVAWVSVQSAPMRDGERLLGHVGTMEDITERRRGEAALRENEARLRLLVSQLPAVLWTVDHDLRFTSSAGAGHDVLNLKPNQLVGVSLFQYFDTDDPEFQPIAAHRRALQGESVHYGLEWGGGSFETVVEPFHDERGEVAGVIGVAMDVSARLQAERAQKESEERYRTLVDQASDGIFIGDADGRYHDVNLAGQEMLGYTREEILARPVSALIAPEDRSRLEPAVRQVLAGKTVLTEWRFRRKDGSLVPTEVSAKRLADGRIQAIVRDISDRRRAEEALRTLSRRLLHVQEEERRRMARELHDEVGQVLTAVKIQIQALSRTREGADRAFRLHECVEGIDHAICQVRDLSLALRPSLLDDLGLAAAIRWYVDRQARDASFLAELYIDKQTPRLASEVETACFRMVQEAVTNVLRHAGAKRVSVSLRPHRDGVEIEVKDDGRGFDPAAVQARAAAGECIGLSGMAERVSLVGGRLAIESSPGDGTLVRALFPVLETESRPA